LLERTSRRVSLTPAGQVLLGEGRRLLQQAERAVRATRMAASGKLVVGFAGSAASVLLPQVLRAFSELHPAIDLEVRELLLDQLGEIADGRVDVAFTRLVPGQADLRIEVLAREPRVVVLPAAHPLAAREAVRFADLEHELFITNPLVRDGGPPARWLEEQQRHGLPGQVAAEASSVQEILTLVAGGRGVCLLPARAARDYPRDDLAYVEVTDADEAVISLASKAGGLRPAVGAFVNVARAIAQ
jgi:DNA-binding transcriptional LysR family regulator